MNNVLGNKYVLPPDVVIMSVSELDEQRRRQFEATEHDFVLSRSGSRGHSQIISEDMASLLSQFRQPKTLVDAIVAFSKEYSLDATRILDGSFPTLQRFLKRRFLVLEGSPESRVVTPSAQVGEYVASYEVVRLIQSLDDNEVFKVKDSNGRFGAMKILRTDAPSHARGLILREQQILAYLDGDRLRRRFMRSENAMDDSIW